MIELQLWEVLLMLGVPSSVAAAAIGLGVWKLQRVIAKHELRREQLEECRENYQMILLQSVNASISLGEATAKALRDGHTNGEVTNALDYATKVKFEQREFIAKQGIKKIV